MKKRAFLAIVFILLFVSLSSATKYECSNKTMIKKDLGEVKKNSVRYINGIGVGDIYSREIPAIRKMETELIIDSEKLNLDLTNPKKEADSLTAKINVELRKINDKNVSLTVGGSAIIMEEGEYRKVGSFDVFISKVYPNLNKTDVIVGNKKIYLSNNGPENYKIKIKNDTFLIEIESASSDNAIISISKCYNEDIVEIDENNNISRVNGSYSNVNVNQTNIVNASQNETGIQNDSLNSSMVKKDIGSLCAENNECLSNLCHRGKCVKRYFFDKVIEWFKNLF